MPKKIKLENIQPKQKPHQHKVEPKYIFCPECGEKITEESLTEEYVCEQCRSLVAKDDKFCWYCGAELEQSNLVEHYHQGEKLSDKEYRARAVKLHL